MDPIQGETFLRVGDLITLKKLGRIGGFMSSEGVIVEELCISRRLCNFEDHLFQVCIQLQYSAKDGLEEFLSASIGGIGASRRGGYELDAENQKLYNALLRGKQNEVSMNETFMQNNTGELVKLGEIIQLKHVKSGKFVTMKKNELARDERANLKITLSAEGSTSSWLQILPRFKINKEGDRIHSGMEIHLKVPESGEFIHCAQKRPPNRKLREINCAADMQTSWSVLVYRSACDALREASSIHEPTLMQERTSDQRSLPHTVRHERTPSMDSKKDHDNILAGEIVIIKDPETQSVLTPFDLLPVTSSSILERYVKDVHDVEASENIQRTALATAQTAEAEEAKEAREEDVPRMESDERRQNDTAASSRHIDTNADVDVDASADAEDVILESTPMIQIQHDTSSRGSLQTPLTSKVWTARETLHRDSMGEDDEDILRDMKDESVAGRDMSTFSEVVLSMVEDRGIDSNALWVLESMQIVNGGPLYCRKDWIRIRHLNTGLYLALTNNMSQLCPDEIMEELSTPRAGTFDMIRAVSSLSMEVGNTYQLTLIADANSHNSLFSAREVNNLIASPLRSHVPLQLKHGDMYIERGSLSQGGSGGGARLFLCGATHSKTKAVSLLISKYREDSNEKQEGLSTKSNDPKTYSSASSTSPPSSSSPPPPPLSSPSSSSLSSSSQRRDAQTRGELFAGPLDVHVGLSMKRHFETFMRLIRLPRDPNTGILLPQRSVFPDAESYEKSLFPVLVDRVNLFLQGYPDECRDLHDIIMYRPNKALRSRRQNLIREQGVIDILLRMLNQLKSLATVPTELMDASDDEEGQLKMISGKAVITACLRLLLLAVRKNKVSQKYVARCIVVVISLIGTDPLAGLLVSEVLSGNNDVHDTNVGPNEINMFVQRMRTYEMSAMFLRLLQSFCSSKGEGIPRVQSLVYEALFQNAKDLLISFDVNFNVKNTDEALNRKVDEEEALGSAIAIFGPPTITVQYASPLGDDSKYDFRKAFGKEKVNLGEFLSSITPITPMPTNQVQAVAGIVKASSNSIQQTRKMARLGSNMSISIHSKYNILRNRVQIAEYLVEQVRLASELCVGRNYAVMNLMEQLYPANLLMAMLVGESFRGNELRSAVVRLLQCLYIDREPDTPAVLPRTVRLVEEITHVDRTAIVSPPPGLQTSPSSGKRMAYLQESLSGILGEEKDMALGSLSFRVIRLAHTLLQFRYYGSVKVFRSILELVAQSLDRRFIETSAVENSGAPQYWRGESARNLVEQSQNLSRVGSIRSIRLMRSSSRFHAGIQTPVLKNQISLRHSSVFRASTKNLNALQGQGRSQRQRPPEQFQVPPAAIPMQTGSSKVKDWEEEKAPVSGLHEKFFSVSECVLNVMNTATYNIATFPLVFLSVVLIIDALGAVKLSGAEVIAIVIYVYFLVEFIVRLMLYWLVSTIDEYVGDIMNFVDFVVIISSSLGFFFEKVPTKTVVFFYVMRILRAGRLLRVARAINKLKDAVANMGTNPPWTEAARYSESDAMVIHTLLEAMRMFATAQRLVEDRCLSLLMERFYNLQERRVDTVAEINGHIFREFEEVCRQGSELVAFTPTFDDTLLDLLMYASRPLVEATIHVLMSRYSCRRILSENVCRLQFLVTEDRRSKYAALMKAYEQARLSVATFDSWKKLSSDPKHHVIFLQACKSFHELRDACRQHSMKLTLGHGEYFESVRSEQDMLLNMGCLSLCIKTVVVYIDIQKSMKSIEIDTVEAEDTGDEGFKESLRTARALAGSSNAFFAALMHDNEHIQRLAFEHIQMFVDTIDEDIASDKVITAIFKHNRQLCVEAPRHYLFDFVNLISMNGREPRYLSYLDAVVAESGIGIRENQYEVIRMLSQTEMQSQFFKFLVPVKHPAYAEKVRLMAPYLDQKNVLISDLPVELQYHLGVVRLLHKCTIGVEGMTTIEAKVQSFCNYLDIIDAMLDPRSLLLVNIRLGLYLEHAILDVEMRIPRVRDAECMWRLLSIIPDVLVRARAEVRAIDGSKEGLRGDVGHRQVVEYAVVLIGIVRSYFKMYYEPSVYMEVDSSVSIAYRRVKLSETRANEIIRSLFDGILSIVATNSPIFTADTKHCFAEALITLNAASSTRIVASVPEAIARAPQASPNLFRRSITSHAISEVVNTPVSRNELMMLKFTDLVNVLKTDSKVKQSTEDEMAAFVQRVQRLPLQNDLYSTAELRIEPLLEKLVEYVRGSIVVMADDTEQMRTLRDGSAPQCVWVLQMLRKMIEVKWGMSIDDRDEDGGSEQDEAVKELMVIFRDKNVPSMCIDLIAKGIDPVCQAEALKLLVGMLFKEGGALEIQKSINVHISKHTSKFFFQRIHTMLQNLISWHKRYAHATQAQPLPRERIVLRFLQLACEGHYQANQNILREQPLNSISVNIIDDLVQYLNMLASIPSATSTEMALEVGSTILEVIQGPCGGNQDHFVFNTNLVETLNRKIRSQSVEGCDVVEELKLKKLAIDIFEALLEGQGQKRDIYERMLSVVHLDVIAAICSKHIKQQASDEMDDGGRDDEAAQLSDEYVEEMVALQTECLVFLEMVFDFRPSLRGDLGLETLQVNVLDVGCVEVMWNGVLQRRFFHIPDICKDLSQATKDKFTLYVDRSSDDNKRYGLIEAAKSMYQEILHQQRLKQLKVAQIFDRTNQERCKWVTFSMIFTINVLFLAFYGTTVTPCPTAAYPDNVCTVPKLPDAVEIAVTVLQVLTIVSSAFTMIQYWLVHVPVIYQSNQIICNTAREAAFRTAKDPFLLYYIVLVSLIWTSFYVRDITPLLLLDIVAISPAVQGILMVTWIPRMALFFALFLTVVVIYIYSAFAFFLYADSDGVKVPDNFDSLADSFKEYVRYGSFAGSIVSYGDYALALDSGRYILDVSFFIATFILWNIVRGITFDQFVVVREANLNRIADTNNKCFICGLEAGVFNRAFGIGAFEKHIKKEHNLWNYVYYIIFLWEQDKDDDDGLETTIRRFVSTLNVSWFPSGRSVSLLNVTDDEEEIDDQLKVHLKTFEDDFTKKLQTFKKHINKSIANVHMTMTEDINGDFLPSGAAVGALTGMTNAMPTLNFDTTGKPANYRASKLDLLRSVPLMLSKSGQVVNKMDMERPQASGSGDEIVIEICVEKLSSVWVEAHKVDRIVCRVTSISNTYHMRALDYEAAAGGVERGAVTETHDQQDFKLFNAVFNRGDFTEGLTREESTAFGGYDHNDIEELFDSQRDDPNEAEDMHAFALGASMKGLSFHSSKNLEAKAECFSPVGKEVKRSRKGAVSPPPGSPVRETRSANGSFDRHMAPQLKGVLVNDFSSKIIHDNSATAARTASQKLTGPRTRPIQTPTLRVQTDACTSQRDRSHRSPRIMAGLSAKQDALLNRFSSAGAQHHFFTVFRGKSSMFADVRNSSVRVVFYLETLGTSEVATYIAAAETSLYDLVQAASEETVLELDVRTIQVPVAGTGCDGDRGGGQPPTKLSVSALVSSTAPAMHRSIPKPGSR